MMRRRIYIAATAIATIVVVGIAAAQEAPTAPAPVVRTPQERGVVSDATRATTVEQAPVIRTPAERGVGTEDQPDQPGLTLEQRQLVESVIDVRTGRIQEMPGQTLEERKVQEQLEDQEQRGISIAARGLDDDLLPEAELGTALPAVATAPAGSVPLFIDPSGAATVSPSPGSQAFTTGVPAGAPATVIVIVTGGPTTASPPTTAPPQGAGTGTTFVDSTTTVSPLFEASQQARRDARR